MRGAVRKRAASYNVPGPLRIANDCWRDQCADGPSRAAMGMSNSAATSGFASMVQHAPSGSFISEEALHLKDTWSTSVYSSLCFERKRWLLRHEAETASAAASAPAPSTAAAAP